MRVLLILILGSIIFVAPPVKAETLYFILAINTDLKARDNIPEAVYQFERGKLYSSEKKCETALISNFLSDNRTARKLNNNFIIESFLGKSLMQQFRCVGIQKIIVE